MGKSRYFGRLAAVFRRSRRVHAEWVSSQQRAVVAAFLIALCSAASAAAQDIQFDPAITDEEFRAFSTLLSQAIFATPVEPARAGSLLDVEVGVATTAVAVDEEAAYWIRATGAGESDLVRSGYLFVPRAVVTKGFSLVGVSASYAAIPGTDVKVLGANLDVPIMRGSAVTPSINIRGTYSALQGVEEYELTNYAAEAFISKGFGPVTPYAAAGIVQTSASGEVRGADGVLLRRLEDDFQTERITLGVRISLLVPKIILEATEGDERTYAAKVSLGF